MVQNETALVPQHLKEYSLDQAHIWAEHAARAGLEMEENKDYIITRDNEGHNRVRVMDYSNTGIVQANMRWSDGLHQFIQLKHSLKLVPENIITCFDSNLAFFKRYSSEKSKIYGLTGTFGTEHSQRFLTELYPVRLAFIPTYKPKRFISYEPIIAEDKNEWMKCIVESVREETNKKKRAILVICLTIMDVDEVEKSLRDRKISSKIRRYTRDDTDERLATEAPVSCGDVILATNIAGRGTDLKTTPELEENGGLHVCLTFFPDNLRVQQQAFGRTSRQGNEGSAQLILNKTILQRHFGDVENSIEIYNDLRDFDEQSSLERFKSTLLFMITLKDELFSIFRNFLFRVRETENGKHAITLMQVEELWGFWLKKATREITEFVQLQRTQDTSDQREAFVLGKKTELNGFLFNLYTKINNGIELFENPSYLVLLAEDEDWLKTRSYQDKLEVYNRAISLDYQYAFGPLYYKALAKVTHGTSIYTRENHAQVVRYQIEAINDLKEAEKLINSLISQLLSNDFAVDDDQPHCSNSVRKSSELSQQLDTKVKLLRGLQGYIQRAISVIEVCPKDQIVKWYKDVRLSTLFYIDTLRGKEPTDELRELSSFGVHKFYELSYAESPHRPWLPIITLGLLGVAQIVIGGICFYNGIPNFGFTFVKSGIQDLFLAIKMAMDASIINWKDWFLQKAFEFAFTFLLDAFECAAMTFDKLGRFLARFGYTSRTAATATGVTRELIQTVAVVEGAGLVAGFFTKEMETTKKGIYAKIRANFRNSPEVIELQRQLLNLVLAKTITIKCANELDDFRVKVAQTLNHIMGDVFRSYSRVLLKNVRTWLTKNSTLGLTIGNLASFIAKEKNIPSVDTIMRMFWTEIQQYMNDRIDKFSAREVLIGQINQHLRLHDASQQVNRTEHFLEVFQKARIVEINSGWELDAKEKFDLLQAAQPAQVPNALKGLVTQVEKQYSVVKTVMEECSLQFINNLDAILDRECTIPAQNLVKNLANRISSHSNDS